MIRAFALLALLLTAASGAVAQQVVRGRVVSAETQTPLSGVLVRLRNVNAPGAVTDAQGRYSLSLPSGAGTLVFSTLGYATLEEEIGGRQQVDVALAASAIQLNELVVVGYTTQERQNVSGAVASVTPEAIATRQVATLDEALKGRVPGVNVAASGEPGRAAQVIIRGQNFIGNSSPLYVVDGMYMRQTPNLDPDDIESLQVLKDASAAAQYGAQAANGVIVIHTKRGRMGGPQIEVRTYYGLQDVPRRVDLADAAQWARINTMARQNAGLPPFPAAVSPAVNTDWQDVVFQRGAIQNHDVTVSGGSENASYLLSGGFLDQRGTILETGFERYSFRVNSEVRRGILTLGENFAVSQSERDNLVGYPLIDAVRLQPTIPVRDPANPSGYGYGSDANPTFGSNPVGTIERETNRDALNQVLGTLYAQVALLDNLRYRFNLGVNYQDLSWRQFIMQRQVRQNTTPDPTELTDRRDNTTSLLFENLLSFEDGWGDHEMSAVLGFTEQREDFRRLQAFRRGFPDESLQQIDAGTAQFNNEGNQTESSLRSFLVRSNYSFADRYLATVSFRRDGSSRFGPGNRYGNFVAGSLGWVISEESFFPAVPLLGAAADYLKLRASYGKLGNQDIGDYQYAASIAPNRSYLFGVDAIAGGATQLSLANPSIRWQDNTQANFGADLTLFDSRLALNADYYVSESGGVLVRAPLPWSLGSEEAPYVNAGTIRNTGFELGASYRVERGGLELTASANLTTVNNEVIELGNDGQDIFAGPFSISRTAVGGPIGAFYVLKTDGIFQSDEEVRAHRAQPNARPGDVRYVDLNGDHLINDEDRYVAGDPNPELDGGFFLDGTYGAFDFALALRGSYGAEVFNVAKFWTDRLDENSNYRAGLEPWTPENRSNTTPRAVFGTAGADNARAVSDRWVEDGSYLRVQNVVLGWALPAGLTSRLGVGGTNSRIYLNVQNAFTFTGYSNWDPEVLGFNPGINRNEDLLARGVDDGRIYPNPRTFTLGIDLSF